MSDTQTHEQTREQVIVELSELMSTLENANIRSGNIIADLRAELEATRAQLQAAREEVAVLSLILIRTRIRDEA